jgi:hypothetical protein
VEGAVLPVRFRDYDVSASVVEDYLGKKATMKMARNIRVFLRFVSKGINVRTRGTNTDLN